MRVLIVEDEHKIANSIKKGLEQEAFAVDIAYDGESGLDMALTEDYDLIVLDLMLPRLSGSEVCQKLRQEKNHTPILILTARGSVEDRINGLNSGADDYLVKPFAFLELLARIRALTRRPKESLETVLEASDLRLDLNNYEVTRENKPIQLSKKEFSLLEFLLRNKNKTLSKDQIINNVWNFDADVLPNTVEVYIGYLRNKVDNSFRERPALIKTIRGFGYRLEDRA